jgi:hypothetical protein
VRLPRMGRPDPVEPEEVRVGPEPDRARPEKDQGAAWEEPRIWAVVESQAAPAWFPHLGHERQE